ncbi:MAG: RIP metalloprotease RseP [Bacteroidota bacterium]|nr:RIP metalloprotease RseP [Bacteroidota bacterium]
MQFLDTIFYFIVTIGVLVFVHELGHFLAAKACSMRVDRFSIGFPPRAFGKKIGETDYCVSWIPIGGYVKIAGMIDESFDTEFFNHEPQPWEFRAKPVWQRVIVICAGVMMNVVLAIVIFWGINFVQGEYHKQTTEIGYVVEHSPAQRFGFKEGDKILSINGEKIEHWDQIQTAMYVEYVNSDLRWSIERRNATIAVTTPRSSLPDISDGAFGILPNQTHADIVEVLTGKPAEKAGFLPGDVILSLNHFPVINQYQATTIIKANAGKAIDASVQRGNEVKDLTVTPGNDGLIGVGIESKYTGPLLHVKYGFFESFPKGVRDVYSATILFVRSIWQIIIGKVPLSKSIGGPIKIAQIATRTAEIGVASFLGFMALLSVDLAVMNILPFPALDGGHLVMLIYEGIVGKPIPRRVQQGIQQAGVVLLLTFMAFVIYNDIAGF